QSAVTRRVLQTHASPTAYQSDCPNSEDDSVSTLGQHTQVAENSSTTVNRSISSRGLDELDAARHSGRTREPTVARQHPGIDHLGQRNVDGVVRAQVVSKLP